MCDKRSLFKNKQPKIELEMLEGLKIRLKRCDK